MNTPICDFIDGYAKSDYVRMHMPGHKGNGALFHKDITEIDGADSLYDAHGIIAESERNAGKIFGAHTFYSAEGSSLSIRAMVSLIVSYALSEGKKPLIAAGRNAHRSFVSAAAFARAEVDWLYKGENYLSADITASDLESYLDKADNLPVAVYITSPDYTGNTADISSIAKVCSARGILLAVDNAHGAYLKFLGKHPIDSGAALAADSAHKTLPVLTGGAYLHVSENAPAFFRENAKNYMALFGSTSPSYLILYSLDAFNKTAEEYGKRIVDYSKKINTYKEILTENGFCLAGNEPMKITIKPKAYGYTGKEFAAILKDKGIMPEFYDPDFLVAMPSPETGEEKLKKFIDALCSIPKKKPIGSCPPPLSLPKRVMSIGKATFLPCETVAARLSEGRVAAASNVSCPPAVSVVVPGERIDRAAVENFVYYGIEKVTVLK